MELGFGNLPAARRGLFRMEGLTDRAPLVDTLPTIFPKLSKVEGPDESMEGFTRHRQSTQFSVLEPPQTDAPPTEFYTETAHQDTPFTAPYVEPIGSLPTISVPTGIDEGSTSSPSPTPHGLTGARLFLAVFFPIAGCFVLCLLGLLCFRLRRQARRGAESSELKNIPSPSTGSPWYPEDDVRVQYPLGFPPAVLAGQPPNGPDYRRPTYQGYFSGVDSSATTELHQTGVNGLSYRGMGTDPPPPYAPRPISAAQRLSQANLAAHNGAEMRSPFADPADDGAVSEVSSMGRRGGATGRDTDNASVVSNFSDHSHPATPHQMV